MRLLIADDHALFRDSLRSLLESHEMEVVGVVGDVRSDGVDRGPTIDVYYPEKLFPQSNPTLVVHTQTEPMAMAPRIREVILDVDDDASILDIKTMETVIVEAQEEGTRRAFEQWGFEPIPCNFRWFNTFGGSFHCATVDVRRRGKLESYF